MSQATVSPIVVPELADTAQGGTRRSIDTLGRIPALVTVIAGNAQMTLADLRDLRVGDIVPLDRGPDATVDICVNGVHIARGDVIVLDENMAARISELEPHAGRRT